MADVPDYPALVDLAKRLKGKDRRTCELALYVLSRMDEKAIKRDARLWAAEVRVAELEAENEKLKRDLKEKK